MEKTFVQLYYDGKVLLQDISIYIEKWHKSDKDIPIYEYLGLTQLEYAAWLENDIKLECILELKKSEFAGSIAQGLYEAIQYVKKGE